MLFRSCHHDEAVFLDGDCVGYVSSGGYAHHAGVSVALAYVPTRLAVDNQQLAVEILGELCHARVRSKPLYDPTGSRMRG